MELNREQIVKDLEACCAEEKDCERCSRNHAPTDRLCIIDLIYDALALSSEIITECDKRDAERLTQVAKLENEVRQARKAIDGLRHYLRLNEDIAIQHEREGRPKTEEYWKGKLAAFAQVEGYIRHEIFMVRMTEETNG